VAKVPGKLHVVQPAPDPAQGPPPDPYIAMAMATMAKMGRLFTPQPAQPQSPPAGSANPILGVRD
jgi:hypothetical protein